MPNSVPETVARIEEKVNRLCLLIEGDDSDNKPGLKLKVDRLVQTEKRRSWILHAFGTGIIGIIAERVWSLLK